MWPTLLVVVACSSGPTEEVRFPVVEALDVPPPPDHESLDIGPTDLACEPGGTVIVEQISLSILDCRDGRVTVYAPAAEARSWLEVGTVSMSAPP